MTLVRPMRIESPARLQLTNGGELSLYFIGTGSAFAKTLNQNNLLIVQGDTHLLIDCGTKCSQALHAAGMPIGDIRHFLITHSHADHVGGLEEVGLFNRYVTGNKPSMIINEQYQKMLWEQSLRGGSEQSEATPLAFTDLWEPVRPQQAVGMPRETWAVTHGPLNIKMPRTMHFPDSAPSWRESAWSCAVIINDRILFTSDTRFDPDLLQDYDHLMQFEIIFHDCQLFTGGVHASLDELSSLPEALKSRMILMHYGDNWTDFRDEAQLRGFHSWARQGHSYLFDSSL